MNKIYINEILNNAWTIQKEVQMHIIKMIHLKGF